jgi:glycosyltransferase involved in cell wall biosynthesis
MVWAASSIGAAERFARRSGLEPAVIVDGRELAARGPRVRELLLAHGSERVIIHSLDWSRQPTPQLYEIAAWLGGASDVQLVDERTGQTVAFPRARGRRAALRLPLELLDGGRQVAGEIARSQASRRRTRVLAPSTASLSGGVLAIYLAGSDTVGGAITHMSGILGALRRAGLRIGLVTDADPPAQLVRVLDDCELTEPLSRGARATTDVRFVAENRVVRRAARRLAARLPPRFVYQRHRGLFIAGLEVCSELNVPLVLEWNASEAWGRAWSRQQSTVSLPVDALFGRLATTMERLVAARASLLVAVSEHAAGMAYAAGADPERVAIVPNGVDLDAIDRALGGSLSGSGTAQSTVGWIGSFGAWHGAGVLVRALARLPADVTALMIGDGPERASSMRLARELGLGTRITWTGVLAHEEALARLGGCELLVSPHVPFVGAPFFGSPTKLFEYMGIGRPIVASRLEQIGEVLEDGRTARLVPPGDHEALARAIAGVLSSPDRGRALGRAAREQAASRHTWDHRAQAVFQRLAP